MKKIKITPGDWRVQKEGTAYSILNEEGSQICYVFTAGMDLKQYAKANAAAIIAIPNTLAALKAILAECSNQIYNSTDPDECIEKIRSITKAALSKANPSTSN